MLLILYLGLIANSALFCDGCDVGNTLVNSFNFNDVGISVLTGFLKQRVSKLLLAITFNFLFPLTNCL